jgi:RNA polymerase sigma-70 factor (ECF subfamily)
MGRSDAELLDAWRAGDRDAGGELFERHFEALYRFFCNKVDDGVDDLIQQTLLACVQAKEGFRGASSFRTWLFTIARHELYEHWRGRAKRAAEDIGEISVIDLGTSPSGLLARRREHQVLLAALRSIPLDLQVALELFYWEQLDGPELARALEIPEGTARSRLRRAREALTERIAALRGAADPTTASQRDLDEWAASLRAELTGRDSKT